MTTPLDLVADNRKWLRLHEHNKYQAEAARRITVLLAEVERLRALIPKCVCGPWHPDMDGPDEECPQHGRSYREWIDRGDRLAATVDRVRALLAMDNDPWIHRDNIRAAIEGTDS